MKKATLEGRNSRTRLSSSLRLNWSLNVEMLLVPFLLLAFNLQFKVKLEVKRGNASLFKVKLEVKPQFQHFLAFMILAFKLQFRLKLELKLHM
ncbi:uncharacterized protein DS421_19g651270 [Arachis hypogaea]|uniref:Uncharacterized protein n=1 Tax=Arachis hypogaea TaxID=3818 RepID=A0A6B9V8B0_ARAHY|nr:uncharacterized protein DS421_19g651270 [Arachis hypogaea]